MFLCSVGWAQTWIALPRTPSMHVNCRWIRCSAEVVTNLDILRARLFSDGASRAKIVRMNSELSPSEANPRDSSRPSFQIRNGSRPANGCCNCGTWRMGRIRRVFADSEQADRITCLLLQLSPRWARARTNGHLGIAHASRIDAGIKHDPSVLSRCPRHVRSQAS